MAEQGHSGAEEYIDWPDLEPNTRELEFQTYLRRLTEISAHLYHQMIEPDKAPHIRDLTGPPRIERLQKDPRGYPIPWFVAWIDGKPDFRLVDPRKAELAVQFKNCWICGEQLGKFTTFVLGPMSSLSRSSGEPPSHSECAEYAIRACPFIVFPQAKRTKSDVGVHHAAGITLDANPGLAVMWHSKGYWPRRIRPKLGNPGLMFEPFEPEWVKFYTGGKVATRSQIFDAFQKGLEEMVSRLDQYQMANIRTKAAVFLDRYAR